MKIFGLLCLTVSVNAQDRKGYPVEALDWRLTQVGWTQESFCCVNGQIGKISKMCGTPSCIIGRLIELPFQLLGCTFLAPCNLCGSTPEHWYLYAKFVHPEDYEKKVEKPRYFIYEMHLNPNLNRIWKDQGCLTLYDAPNKDKGKTGKEVCAWLKKYRPTEFPPCQDFVRKFYTQVAGYDVHPGEFPCLCKSMNLCGPMSWFCARRCHCATKGVANHLVPCGEVLRTKTVGFENVEGAEWVNVGSECQSLYHPKMRWTFGRGEGRGYATEIPKEFFEKHQWMVRVIYETSEIPGQHGAAKKWLEDNGHIEKIEIIEEEEESSEKTEESETTSKQTVADIEVSDSSDDVAPIDDTPVEIPEIQPTTVVIVQNGFGSTEIIAILAVAIFAVLVVGIALSRAQIKNKTEKADSESDIESGESDITTTCADESSDIVTPGAVVSMV